MKRTTDYQIAKEVMLTMVDLGMNYIAPGGYYDDDADLVDEIIKRCALSDTSVKKNTARLFRVCNKLCHCGIFYGVVAGTHKEYFGEPTKQREFRFTDPSYYLRLLPDYIYSKGMEPDRQREAKFLLRHFQGARKNED